VEFYFKKGIIFASLIFGIIFTFCPSSNEQKLLFDF